MRLVVATDITVLYIVESSAKELEGETIEKGTWFFMEDGMCWRVGTLEKCIQAAREYVNDLIDRTIKIVRDGEWEATEHGLTVWNFPIPIYVQLKDQSFSINRDQDYSWFDGADYKSVIIEKLNDQKL